MSVEDKVRKYIDEHRMLGLGDKVVAGISGGADSMCMLLLLQLLSKDIPIDITVVHINHGIRGESADKDERFVEDFCLKNGIRFEAVHADILKLAKEQKLTCEEAGRNFRYQTFGDMVQRLKADECNGGQVKVAIAHNSDDNAETVLFNLFRGSGITGLGGIRPVRVRGLGEASFSIIRPILCLTRAEIEEYLNEKGVDYCTDETNLTDDYSRNCIRHMILPKAKEYINESVIAHLSQLSNRASEIDDYLNIEADRFIDSNLDNRRGELRLEIDKLQQLHSAVRGVVLRKMLGQMSRSMKDIEQRHVDLMWKLCQLGTGKKLDLPYELSARNEYGHLIIYKKNQLPEGETSFCDFYEVNGDRDEIANDYSGRLVYEVLPYSADMEIPRGADEKWFDYDQIKGKLCIRKREEGDYLLIGRAGHKKSLNRYFIDEKVPEKVRNTSLLLAEGSHILYVAGLRRDDSYPVTADTKKILVVRYIHD